MDQIKVKYPIKTEILSPSQYLEMNISEKRNVQSVKVIPPKLGEDHYGKFEVTYKSCVWK